MLGASVGLQGFGGTGCSVEGRKRRGDLQWYGGSSRSSIAVSSPCQAQVWVRCCCIGGLGVLHALTCWLGIL